MPATKMKAMSTTTCKRKGSYPHESHKSNKICIAPSSMVRVTPEMENLAISSQTSHTGFSVNEVSYKEHGDGNNQLSCNIDIIEGQTCVPFNASGSIEEMDSLPFSHSSSSHTMLSYFSGPDDAHCNQFETVTREQIAVAPQVDANNFPNFQMPDLLDSYACEMFLNGFSVDGINIFGDNQLGDSYSYSLSDLEFVAANLICDLPTLEETIEAADYNYGGPSEELLQMSDPSWFQLMCHQAKPIEDLDAKSSQFDSARVDYSDPEAFIKNILDLSDESNSLPGLVSMETGNKKHITLVLDLDETLVHSTMVPCDGADFTIQIFLDKEHTVYVRQRPFLETFLRKVSEMFEIIIFTASKRLYAEKLLDVLDPENKFFSRRLYRDSCIFEGGTYTKDLTVLGIDLSKVFIIDNTPQVYRLQVNNGIPIVSWFEDPSDTALISMLPFLEELAHVDDVRPIIAEKFGARNK